MLTRIATIILFIFGRSSCLGIKIPTEDDLAMYVDELENRTNSTGLSKLALEKNLEMTIYLRRRLIQVMIQKGIR